VHIGIPSSSAVPGSQPATPPVIHSVSSLRTLLQTRQSTDVRALRNQLTAQLEAVNQFISLGIQRIEYVERAPRPISDGETQELLSVRETFNSVYGFLVTYTDGLIANLANIDSYASNSSHRRYESATSGILSLKADVYREIIPRARALTNRVQAIARPTERAHYSQ
jgi:hypothetical protein